MTQEEWLHEFKMTIRDFMDECGYTQTTLAIQTGLSRKTIHQYCRGAKIPEIRSVLLLARAFDCDVDDLVNFGSPIDIL